MYTIDDLKLLEKQEELLSFDSFGYEDALKIGLLINEISKQYGPIALQIRREEDECVLCQLLMDVKGMKNIRYIEGKRKTVLKSGHSSFYEGVRHKIEGDYVPVDEDGCMYVGGSYPIIIDDKVAYTISMSGLHEGKDQVVIMQALSEYLGVKIPVFMKEIF